MTTAAATKALANEHRATFELGAAVSSNGSNVLLVNNGQGVRISWTQTGFNPKVLITVKDGQAAASGAEVSSRDKVQQVVAVPQQFHFHAHSEHLLQGEQQFCTFAFVRPLHPARTPCRQSVYTLLVACCW